MKKRIRPTRLRELSMTLFEETPKTFGVWRRWAVMALPGLGLWAWRVPLVPFPGREWVSGTFAILAVTAWYAVVLPQPLFFGILVGIGMSVAMSDFVDFPSFPMIVAVPALMVTAALVSLDFFVLNFMLENLTDLNGNIVSLSVFLASLRPPTLTRLSLTWGSMRSRTLSISFASMAARNRFTVPSGVFAAAVPPPPTPNTANTSTAAMATTTTTAPRAIQVALRDRPGRGGGGGYPPQAWGAPPCAAGAAHWGAAA